MSSKGSLLQMESIVTSTLLNFGKINIPRSIRKRRRWRRGWLNWKFSRTRTDQTAEQLQSNYALWARPSTINLTHPSVMLDLQTVTAPRSKQRSELTFLRSTTTQTGFNSSSTPSRRQGANRYVNIRHSVVFVLHEFYNQRGM